MAGLSEGAYVLINVGSQKALDVQWSKNKYQKWTVLNTRHSDWICQTWILDNQSNGWQITNYATWGCLDASDAHWVQQLKDSNTTAQRWTITENSDSFTYGGVSYQTYTITSKSSTSKKLARVAQGGTDWGGYSTTNNNYIKWIFVPAPVISDNGTYYIVPATDSAKCIEISSGSKANDATAIVNSRNSTKNYQTFTASVNVENGSVQLINQNSNRALDIWKNKSGNPDWVGQYTKNATSQSQRWYISRVSGAYITINKVKYPAYTIRSVKSDYSSYYMTVVKGSIKMRTLQSGSDAISQRFTFIPTEFLSNGLTVPGKITKTSFTTNSARKVTVKGLQFSSEYRKFQIRYMLKKYKVNRKTFTKTAWANINGSKANSGWGPAGTFSIELASKAKNGVVTISADKFSPTYTLAIPESSSDTTSIVAIDLIMEVRAFADITKNGTVFRNARSTEQSTTIKIRQTPSILLKTFDLVMSPGSSTGPFDDAIGLTLSVENSLKEGLSNLRARLVGENSIPISDWVSDKSSSLNFYIGKSLYRLPNQNEKVSIQYSVVTTTDNVRRSGTLSKTFAYPSSSSLQIAYAKDLDGSRTAIIRVSRHDVDCCFMEVSFLSGKKLVPCKCRGVYSGNVEWIAVPPLNKDTTIIVYSKNKNSSTIMRGEAQIRLDGHEFIWNWGSSAKAIPSQFATLVVNPDAPPQQKRSYTSDIQFQNPAGRLLPVGFAGKTLTVDVSVTGVSIDANASYVSSGPLPPHNEVEYLALLAELAGNGIHPIYRTPYGDWHQVGVSVVDISKNNMNYSDVSITQRALED